MKHRWMALLGISALVLAGCGGFGSSSGNPQQPQSATLSVTPASAAIRGGDSQPFTARTSDGSTPALVWSVNGVTGGSASTGTITASGMFTAPQFPPTPNTVTITAAESANTAISGSGVVTLNNPVPQVSSVTPTSIPVGAFTLTVAGANFAPGATVFFGTTALTTNRVSATQMTATGTATAGKSEILESPYRIRIPARCLQDR